MRRLLALTLLLAPQLASAQDTLDQAVENDLTLDPVLPGLAGPTAMEFLPDGRLMIIQQSGEVLLWDGFNLAAAGTIPTDAGGERGLLGLAIDPMFSQTNRVYFYYSGLDYQQVAWTTLDPGTSQLDTNNLTVIIDHLSADRNHDGGGLHFGPDDNLYIGVGDTGCNCGCDPGTNTNNYFPTCLTKYHGKILRIDRDGNAPADNPLVGVTEAPECGGAFDNTNCTVAEIFPTTTADPLDEIYLWGFRNPWRFTFDSQTGFLWIGDVGETTWEEVTISRGGGEHHGWPFREGADGQNGVRCSEVVPQSTGDCVDPVFAYNHSEQPASGQGSITGGVFSNHCSWPAPWNGLYWFGDYNKSRIWTLTPNANRDGVDPASRQIIARNVNGPVHITNGPDGSIYYLTINDGEIWRIGPANPAPCPDMDAGAPDALTPGDAMVGMDAMEPVDGNVGMDAQPIDMGMVADTGLGKDAGGGSDADTTADAGDGEEEDDCACTSTRARRAANGWWMLLGLLALRLLSSSRARRDR
jgi:glucose/arabinose dehydrogenase